MSRNTLVINCDLRETRVALIENGVIAELQIERAAHRGTVGNIVLGRVSRVLPGMQAAFIDVGMERAAFLHVEDLIRPNDFEAYLAGDFSEVDKEESGKDVARKAGASAADDDEDDEDEDEDEAFFAEGSEHPTDDDDDEHEKAVAAIRTPSIHPETARALGLDEDEINEFDEDEDEDDDDDDEPLVNDDDDEDDDEDDDAPESDRPAAAIPPVRRSAHPPRTRTAPPPRAAQEDVDDRAEEEEEEEERRGRRRKRRRRSPSGGGGGSGSGTAPRAREEKRQGAAPAGARERKGRRGSERDRKKNLRVSRSVPITEVVKEGDPVIVQVSKEPIGTKGARVTSHVSLPGRYCVFLPTVDHIGISKRIGSSSERARLREVIETMKPKSGGVIVRTVAQGLTKKSLKTDLGYLMRLWSDVSKKVETAKAPHLLYTELDLVLKTARDLFTDEIDKIVIDDKDQYARLVRFVEMFLPTRVKDVELYQGDEPIFDAYGIEDEIARALSRKVPLPSGGYLIIDQAEALTAIDVNTGRFVGKGSSNLEETALKTNLEAVEEIAYQLRFRNVGGLVVLDLIDMEDRSNRDKVYRALDQSLKKDKAKTTINRISDLGLIEMTRKRTRESLSRTMHEPCFYCDGTGHIQSRTTIAYEILRQVRREKKSLPGYSIVVNAHPAVIDTLQGDEKAAVKDAEARYMRRIKLVPRKEYHIEQFDLKGE